MKFQLAIFAVVFAVVAVSSADDAEHIQKIKDVYKSCLEKLPEDKREEVRRDEAEYRRTGKLENPSVTSFRLFGCMVQDFALVNENNTEIVRHRCEWAMNLLVEQKPHMTAQADLGKTCCNKEYTEKEINENGAAAAWILCIRK